MASTRSTCDVIKMSIVHQPIAIERKWKEWWIKLKSVPMTTEDYYLALLMIDKSEFVIYHQSKSGQCLSSLQYNSHFDEYNEYMPPMSVPRLSFGEVNCVSNGKFKKLYFKGQTGVCCLNLETKECRIVPKVPKGHYIVFINHNLHIINNYNRHWIGSFQHDGKLNVLQDTLSADIPQLVGGKAIYHM